MTATLTGDKALDKKLARLADKAATKVSRKAVNQGMTVLAKAMRAAAPDKVSKKSIGKRYKKKRTSGVIEAKVGINVGQNLQKQQALAKDRGEDTPKQSVVHLIALGTDKRQTAKGANRGSIEPNDFVARAYQGAESTAKQKIERATLEGITKEASK